MIDSGPCMRNRRARSGSSAAHEERVLVGVVRLLIRAFILALWTFAAFGARLCFLPVALFAPSAEMKLMRGAVKTWARVAWRVAGVRLDLRGAPPDPPFYLVSNHLTYVDIVVLAGLTGAVFVAKSEVAAWPVIGFMARHINTLFIDRKRMRDTKRINDEIASFLERGAGVLVFAEGGVAQSCTVNPFKPSLLEPAVQRNWPVHYVTVSYSTPPDVPPAKQVIAWLDGTSFGAHVVRLLQLRGFTCHVTFGDAPMTAPDRKELARKLCDAVAANFVPLNE